MPGKGKYTNYVPKKSARRTFMEKLFPAAPFVGVDDADAPALFSAMGNKYLVPAQQAGNPDIYPQGVRLDFKSDDAPDFNDVAWAKAGDPASPYFADLRSPGPGPEGQVNVVPLDSNPDLSPTDIKPNFVPGVLGTSLEGGGGTVNPPDTTAKIVADSQLGKDFTLGSSQK